MPSCGILCLPFRNGVMPATCIYLGGKVGESYTPKSWLGESLAVSFTPSMNRFAFCI